MRLSLALALFVSSLAALLAVPSMPALADGCRFVLGFKTLHDAIPDIVGECTVNEHDNPRNGDALQETTSGLLVWRKADSFTAFTDGNRTWVNGPFGLETRFNAQRFVWEPDALDVPGNMLPLTREQSTFCDSSASLDNAVSVACFLAYANPNVMALGNTAQVQPIALRAAPTPNPAIAISLYLGRSYDPAVELYREAPNVAPNTYWVYSDGYLAGLDVSKWSVPVLTKWTVLVDHAIVPEETLTYRHRDLDLGGGVRSEAPDPDAPRLADWQEYADRVLLAAINAQNAGNKKREAELMKIAHGMWNGRGMDDKFHRVTGSYQTYHVALYYYMTGRADAGRVLLTLQEKDPASNRYGGIYTEYGEDGRPLAGTDTNIETSAVTMRALSRKQERTE